MIDPMANLDGGAPGATDTNEKDVIDITSLRYNLERVDKIRSVMGISSGCVAGICGLTGLEGLGTLNYLMNEKQGFDLFHILLTLVCHFFQLVFWHCTSSSCFLYWL